jgi:hypothetical protein
MTSPTRSKQGLEEKKAIRMKIFNKGWYTKKEARELLSFIVTRMRVSKMDRTLMIIDIKARNEDGEFS